MKYTKAKTIANTLIIVAALLFLSLYLFTKSAVFNTIMTIVFLLALALVAASVIITVKYYRCPHCDSLLRVRGWGCPAHCPECGKAL